MAYRYPPAEPRYLGPLPPSEPKMTAHDVICVHTMVGTLWGTDAFFHDQGWSGTESHYGTGFDGQTLEWCPLDHQADANLDGNSYVISIENADKGEGFPAWEASNVPNFTSAQIDRLVDLIDKLCRPENHASCPASWTCHQVGIPRVLIPDTRRGHRGIGYHRQGIDPWLVDGGVRWSNKTGKVCPGDRRVAQLRDIIVPRVQALAEPQPEPEPPPEEEDDDMKDLIIRADGKSPIWLRGETVIPLVHASSINNLKENGDVVEKTITPTDYDSVVRELEAPELTDAVETPNP